MFSYLFICYLVQYNICLALTLPSNNSLLPLSNLSDTAIGGRNQSLGAWSPVPWSSPLGDGLTLVVTEYGRFADPANWDRIRSSLDRIRQEYQYFPPRQKPRIAGCRYQDDLVVTEFDCAGRLLVLPLGALSKVIRTIEAFFFDYHDNPRELSAEIRLPTHSTIDFSLVWKASLDAWPRLPWDFSIGGAPDLRAEVYLYGTEIELAFKTEIRTDILGIVEELTSDDHVVTRTLYPKNRVTLKLLDLTLEDGTILLREGLLRAFFNWIWV
ncbi:hypothetical protein ACLMJK_006324 [Lecanora helva]